jgi:hypothetical protein
VRAAAEPAFVDGAGVDPTDLVPLSPPAAEGFGWDGPLVATPLAAIDALAAQLEGEVMLDDLGRRCVSGETARRLLAERAALEVRRRELQERQDAKFRELAAAHPVWGGVAARSDWDAVSAASLMLAAAKDARPRRQSVLQHALSNQGVIEYHPVEQVPE